MNENSEDKIEVFKTNIQKKAQSKQIKSEILKKYPDLLVSFDLEDVDRVLRVEGLFNTVEIIKILVSKQYKCELMH
ncbi:hypothetical protein [Allomuricauda sp. M10]|uniref:hypothetical protein n=1 Tax=Allomuricauda sp. M10 TaxID=2683292 RepID=UPI001D18C00D|nr:hypothetical protein [Muricauda sp. M10]